MKKWIITVLFLVLSVISPAFAEESIVGTWIRYFPTALFDIRESFQFNSDGSGEYQLVNGSNAEGSQRLSYHTEGEELKILYWRVGDFPWDYQYRFTEKGDLILTVEGEIGPIEMTFTRQQ